MSSQNDRKEKINHDTLLGAMQQQLIKYSNPVEMFYM